MLSDWAVYVRDDSYDRVAQLDEIISLECVERHLGLGAWVLELPFEGAAVDALLTTPGSGIEVRHKGRPVFSGPMRSYRRERGLDQDRITINGWDDMVALHARVVHPQPLTATPPFNTDAYDTQTGPASTVLWNFINRNAGSGGLAARLWPGLTMATNPAEGPTITHGGRWQNLLELVAELGRPHGMSVTVRSVTGGSLVCTVRVSRDKTAVELSPRAGTLEGWTVEVAAPEVTYGWAGGQGDLTAREVVQDSVTPPAQWPWRVEKFLDYRSAEDTAELNRSLDDALVEGAEKQTLVLVPSESLSQQYGVDFDLGDTVTVILDGVRSTEVVSSATLRFTDGVPERTFTVGPDQPAGLGAVFAQMRRLGSRVRNLEGI